jgi:hypothetical protein
MAKGVTLLMFSLWLVLALIGCSLPAGPESSASRPPRTASCPVQVLATRHLTLGVYRLEARLIGTVAHSRFCGDMAAEAHLITPSHGVSGKLSVFLTNCHDNDLATKSISVPAPGAYGQNQTVSTALMNNGCGYASALFIRGALDTIAVHTDAINASGEHLWEQWRG